MQIVAQGLGMNYGRDTELKLNRAMLWLLVIGTDSGRYRRTPLQQAGGDDLAQSVRDRRHADRRGRR